VGGKFPEDQVKDAAVGKHVFEELVSFLLFWIVGHIQTILWNINVIMTLRPDPLLPLVSRIIATFWGF
jgi:hypothetical protein